MNPGAWRQDKSKLPARWYLPNLVKQQKTPAINMVAATLANCYHVLSCKGLPKLGSSSSSSHATSIGLTNKLSSVMHERGEFQNRCFEVAVAAITNFYGVCVIHHYIGLNKQLLCYFIVWYILIIWFFCLNAAQRQTPWRPRSLQCRWSPWWPPCPWRPGYSLSLT